MGRTRWQTCPPGHRVCYHGVADIPDRGALGYLPHSPFLTEKRQASWGQRPQYLRIACAFKGISAIGW